MNPLFPREYHQGMNDILKLKFPKYFTGKFHPSFYTSYTPSKQNQYLKVTKSIKTAKAVKIIPNPSASKTFEMYYFRNQRATKIIHSVDFQSYKPISLTVYTKKFLKNYFWALDSPEQITINVKNYEPFIYELLILWIQRLKNLKILTINDVFNSDKIPKCFIKNVIKSASQTLRIIQLQDFILKQINFIEEINQCKLLEGFCFNCLVKRQNVSQFSLMDFSRLKQFSFQSPSCNAQDFSYLLRELKQCEELEFSFSFDWQYAKEKDVQEICDSIPKKLKYLKINSEKGVLKSNNQYEALGSIVVENKFILNNWKPDNKLDYLQIFNNKNQINYLEIQRCEVDVVGIRENLLSFTKLKTLKIYSHENFLEQYSPITFDQLFQQIPIQSFYFVFDTSKTSLESIIQLMKSCLIGGQIRELCLIQINKVPCQSLLEFFLNQQKKNFSLTIHLDAANPLFKIYRQQFRRYKWVLQQHYGI